MTPQRQHNHHNHGRRRRKWSPRASQDALRPAPMQHIDRGRSPEQAGVLFVIGHMPLKTLRCCGGTSSLEQRSVLRGMHPINPTPKHICLLGGLSRSIRRVSTRNWLLSGTLGAYFHQRRSWLGWLCV